MHDFHSLTINHLSQETKNSVSIGFEIPEHLKTLFSFKAGQYLTLKHEVNGQELRRAYSIYTASNSQTVRVGIKKVADGSFSVFANNQLKIGDKIEVMPPQGKFILSPDASQSKNYLAFAAGSGITPVLSIITTALEEEPQSTFLLIYGNKSILDTMFYKDIMLLKSNYQDRFLVEFIFSQTQEDDALFGRISKANANFFLKNKYSETAFDDTYLCGPESMINEVKATLIENKMDSTKIHFELFTASEEENKVDLAKGKTEVTMLLDDETFTFTMSQKKVVLDAALSQKIDAPFSCQGGICSTCIARVVEGKVEMIKNQILTDGELAEGLILTCQAHPVSPTLTVDYDDV